MTVSGELSTIVSRCSKGLPYHVSTIALERCGRKLALVYIQAWSGVGEKVTARAEVWFWSDTLGLVREVL